MMLKPALFATAAIVITVMTLYFARDSVRLAIGDFLVVHDELQPADAIHVIAGPDNTRIDYGVQLFQKGYARQIIFTGGWCDCINANSALHSRQRAIDQGVPAEAIVIDSTEIMSTYAEVGRLQEIISHSRPPIRSVIGVSDPFHMWRSRWTYRQVLGQQIPVQMAPVPFEQGPYRRYWWRDPASRQYVRDEYAKIVYYFARYKFSSGAAQDWLASLDRE
jgi:uncharacterized SAM-binding protein YcdF (DUF218 family)